MSQQILGYPRKLLTELAKTIRAIKDLRGKPDGFVGTGANGYAETDQLGSGTASAGTVLLGNNTWGAAGGAISAGDYNDIEVVSATDWRVEAWGGRKVVTTVAELEAAVSAAVSGDVIFVAAGTYTLTSEATLTINVPNVTICGAGPRSTILRQTDYDTDIISIRRYKVTIEGMTIHHGTTYESNGAGSAGYGRGIVVEQPTSVSDNITDVTIRNVHLFNTANWSIFDTGGYSYDVLATPVADSGGTTYSPCYGYDSSVSTTYGPLASSTTINNRTVTSVLQFGNVRVGMIVTGANIPHNTRVVAKASSSSITISNKATATGADNLTFKHSTDCAVSVALTIEDCVIGFWNSGGCIHVGYGSTTTRISALKNNGYSFGSYTSHFGGATEAVTIGAVHIYGGTVVTFDRGCIFQSPSDNVTLPDKDATMVSFHQTNVVNVFGPYIEVLSTNCADSLSGAGGREYWLFTSMNCASLNVHDCFIRSGVTNPAVTDEGYPIRVWKTSVDDSVGSEIHFKGGIAFNKRLYYNGTTRVATEPYVTGDQVASWDRDDFVLRGTGDASIKRPINIEDFWIVNLEGLGRRPPTIPTGSTISNRLHFRISNSNRNLRLAPWTDNDYSGLTTAVDDIRARTLLAHELKAGMMGYVNGNSGGNGRRNREGLWIASTRDGEFKQVPFMRVHSSFFPTPIAGDLWMEATTATGANNDWRDAKFHWYHNGVWLTVVGISRGTTAAGDLIYYTAADTPTRLAAGTTGHILTQAAGPAAPAWAAPDFKDTLFRVQDDGDASKKLALECSGITASTTRTIKAQDASGSAVIVGNAASASGVLGAISLTGQTTSLGTQTLLTGNASSAGLYRVSFYSKCTTAGDAGDSLVVDLAWNDGTAQTLTGATGVALDVLNQWVDAQYNLYAAASQNITFTTTVNSPGAGTPAYSIYARIEAIG